MRTVKKYVGILLMLTLFVGFTSCEDDEDIFDEVVGRTWVGDLGFSSFDDFREPLESGIYLGSDGFGEDKLLYYDNGDYYDTLRLQWSVRGGSIFIDYGNAALPRELRNVYFSRGRLTASLYIDGRYFDEVELLLE